jgi:hypothetical protein
VAIDELGFLPLVDVADLLGLERADVDGVLVSIAVASAPLGALDPRLRRRDLRVCGLLRR